jgi:hypothetical protein
MKIEKRISLKASLNRGLWSDSEDARLLEPPLCHNALLFVRVSLGRVREKQVENTWSVRYAPLDTAAIRAPYESVRKVVPTLTSKNAEIYISMVGAKKHNNTGLSWFRPWVVRPACVRSGAVLRCTVVLTEGSYKQGGTGEEAFRSLRFD